MKTKTVILLRSLLLTLLAGQTMATLADDDHDEARRLRQAGDILPLDKILQELRPRYPGKVLEVELEHKAGQIIYEVEMLFEDGMVHELYIDAKTGKVLRNKVDD